MLSAELRKKLAVGSRQLAGKKDSVELRKKLAVGSWQGRRIVLSEGREELAVGREEG